MFSHKKIITPTFFKHASLASSASTQELRRNTTPTDDEEKSILRNDFLLFVSQYLNTASNIDLEFAAYDFFKFDGHSPSQGHLSSTDRDRYELLAPRYLSAFAFAKELKKTHRTAPTPDEVISNLSDLLQDPYDPNPWVSNEVDEAIYLTDHRKNIYDLCKTRRI